MVGRRGAGGPRGATLGDCIAAAGAGSQRTRKATLAEHHEMLAATRATLAKGKLHGCRNPLGTAAVAHWQPSLGSGALGSLQREEAIVAAVARDGRVGGDCIAAAGPQRSRRQRKAAAAQPGCRHPTLPLGTPAVARWQPTLGVLQREEAIVAAIARYPVGGVVEAVVDSGAEESVAPPGFFAAAVVPSPMSRAGFRYRAANGSRIKNVGQQRVAFTTSEGHHAVMPFQVAEVERPLISVAQLTSAGHRVVLGDAGGQIVHEKSGRTIELVRRGDVYLLMMTEGRLPPEVALGFPRQGK